MKTIPVTGFIEQAVEEGRSRSATKPELSPLWMKMWPMRRPAVPKAAQPRPLAGLPSSKPSHENSAQAAPSRAP